MKGLLDENDEVKFIRSINASWLIHEYLISYGIDVSRFFENVDEIEIYKEIKSEYQFYYPLSISGDGEFYAQMEKNEWYYNPFKWEHRIALDFIPLKSNVLEIGAGKGDFLKLVRTKFASYVLGLEQNPSAIRHAMEQKITLLPESIQSHEIQNHDSYDIVCGFQILEHISEVNSFIKSSVGCLKKGGHLIFAVPNNNSFIKYDTDNSINMPPHHMGLWNEKSLRSIARLFSLQLINIYYEPLQKYHVDYYRRIMEKRYFNNGLIPKLINKTGLHVVIDIILGMLKSRIRGHTILGVYKK